MSQLNHKRNTSSLAPPIFYVAKQSEDRRFPIDALGVRGNLFDFLGVHGAKNAL